MNKIFIFAAVIFLHANVTFASVGTNTANGVNYKMSYPIVYTNNKVVQDKINQDIYHYIATFRDDYNAGRFYKGWFSYDVKFENDDYVSLTITDTRYNMRAAHENYHVYGIVYDKHTGRKLPLSYFLKVTLSDLKNIYSGRLYNKSGNKLKASKFNIPERISEDYYLLGNGGIALIYRPFELGAFSDGATTIRLTSEEVDYFNRKNRN